MHSSHLSKSLTVVAAMASMLSLSACDRDPGETGGLQPTPVQSSSSGAPSDRGAQSMPAGDATTAVFAGLQAPKPESWVAGTPSSSMRAAQYSVPGTEGAGDAEFVVFANIGGSNDANITRWVGQFSSPDGTGVEPVLQSIEVNGMPITVVYLEGIYSGMLPSGAPTEAQQDTGFLAAIVEAPATILHLRLLGPRATVEANREAFMTLLDGLKPAGAG